jgi:hypothetical protein
VSRDGGREANQSVAAVHMKNCEPLVLRPEFAIERVPDYQHGQSQAWTARTQQNNTHLITKKAGLKRVENNISSISKLDILNQYTRPGVAELEVFIVECTPVNGATSGAVVCREITPLTHETGYDAMEG